MARWIALLLLLCGGCSGAPSRELFEQSSCAGAPYDVRVERSDCTSEPLRVVAGCPEGTHFSVDAQLCEEGGEPIALAFDGASQHAPEIRNLFRSGTAQFHMGQYEQAKQHFAKAYEQTRYYAYAFNLALSERELGRMVRALELFRAIAVAEPMTHDKTFERARKRSEALVAQLEKQVGKLKVVFIEDDASSQGRAAPELTLDSQRVSPKVATVGLLVDPGLHEIAVRGRCKPTTYQVLVDEGGSSDVGVNIPPLR